MKAVIPRLWGETFPVTRAKDSLEHFRDDFFGVPTTSHHGLLTSQWPLVDISEDEKAVCVKAEVPGLSEKDLELTYKEGVLTLKGEKKGEHEEKKKNTYYKECWQGQFCRHIPLAQNLDWERADAKYHAGTLKVSIPKKVSAEHQMKIKVD